MKYQSGGAFRRALETRLKTRSRQEKVLLIRLRKMVAFERLLARLLEHQPEGWVLKGGYALQLRLGDRARTTKDIDVLFRDAGSEVHASLVLAGSLDLGDWFAFEIGRPVNLSPDAGGGLRCGVHSLLDGRTFENFGIDVGVGDPIVGPVEYLHAPGYLTFSDIEPLAIPSYPVSQQIAEKLHAYTKPRRDRENTRIKDFVDILLLAELGRLDGGRLRKSIQATFDNAGTHPVPASLPQPPANWESGYRKLAAEIDIEVKTLEEAYSRIREFINPILERRLLAEKWRPDRWSWE